MVIQQLLSVSAASLFGFPGKEHNLLDVHKLWIYILLVYWMYKTILLDIYWMYIHKLKKYPMDPAKYLLRKYDWGMITRGCLVPSQTVAMDP